MWKRSPFVKGSAFVLSLVTFSTNCVFAHVAELNFWAERKSVRSSEKKDIQLASLPTSGLPEYGFPPGPFQNAFHSTLGRTPLFQALPLIYGSARTGRTGIHIQDVHISRRAIPPFVGVDDPRHFQSNVEAYRRSASSIASSKRRLAALETELSRRKTSTFNSALLAFDGQVQAYRRGSLKMGDYLHVLSRSAGTRDAKNARTFLDACGLESSLNFSHVESERARLISQLMRKLTPTQTARLANSTAAYRLGALRQSEFYAFLNDLCRASGIRLDDFPAMSLYLRYVLLADGIDENGLFNEIAQLEKETYASLVKKPEETELINESTLLFLAGKLVDFSLTADEWAEYQRMMTPSLLRELKLSSARSSTRKSCARIFCGA